MTGQSATGQTDPAAEERFATLHFAREIAAPPKALWQAWTEPSARAAWAAPGPGVEVELVAADPREGGREVMLCRTAGEPEIRCETGWLVLQPERRSVNWELVSAAGAVRAAALVTAEIEPRGEARSHLALTVQLSALAPGMAQGYRQGFGAGLDSLAGLAARTMVLERVVRAPRSAVWRAWTDPAALPQWWGPDGYSCRTRRIDLRPGGEWVFDMIGPDGTVYPNHHLYREMQPEARIAYALLWGENGPKHADAWASFVEEDGATRIVLGMVLASAEEFDAAMRFGAVELGQQTLGKLERFIAGA